MRTARPTSLRRSPRFLCPKPAATSKNNARARKEESVNSEKKIPTKRRSGSKGLVNSCVKSSTLREEGRKNCVAATEAKRRSCCLVGVAEVDAASKKSECGLTGWSKEQETALQRAYIVAKPTPHFWKKVSTLVPGKSAQECFDKVNSDLSTPPPRRPQSRAKKTATASQEASPISASKVLNPVKTVSKRSRSNQQKQAQKTLRHLLQKQYRAEQDNQADLFSILEPNFDPSTKLFDLSPVFSTPENLSKSRSFLLNPSSSLKKPISRFSSSNRADLVSPPVLKNVKNWALHEKYLDQLHTRDARRKRDLGLARKNLIKENEFQRIDAVKSAKSALISDVKNAIDQLQNLQCSTGVDSSDLCDDFDVEDDEGGDEFQ